MPFDTTKYHYPPELICPLTQKVFVEPVFVDGRHYEKDAYIKQFKLSADGAKKLVIDDSLKKICADWHEVCKSEDIHEHFCCPIGYTTVQEATIVLDSGHTFSKAEITRWLNKKDTNETTKAVIAKINPCKIGRASCRERV